MGNVHSRKQYDVIVIGAGPAGTAAAAITAAAGISTLILDKKKIVGIPNHCGEGISHYVLKLLGSDEHKPWIVKKMKGAKIFFPNLTFAYYRRTSYCIDRVLFDQDLADHAIKKGASLLLDRLVVNIVNNSKALQVVTKNGEEFLCSYVIAADGALSTVRKIIGLRHNVITAMQYKFEPIKRFEDNYFLFYHGEKYQPGYSWVFDRGVELSIGIGGIGNIRPKLESFIESLGIDPKLRKSVQAGAIPSPRRPVTLVHSKIVFAGDAGGFIFPSTGAGIIGALTSGRIAGEVIRDVLVTRDHDIIQTYEQKVQQHPSRSGTVLSYCRKFLSLRNVCLNAIGTVIDKKTYADISMAEVFHTLTARPHINTIRGLVTGFAARQILRRYRGFVF